MKCEKCGKNEVTFIYHSNVNGSVEEKHLCSECAEQMGYLKALALRQHSLQQGIWEHGLLGRSLFEDVFKPTAGWFAPFEALFEPMPAWSIAAPQEEAAEEKLIDEKEQSRFARMRKLNALRVEMKKAVREEAFERAAQLRDEIRALEQAKDSA